MHALTQIPTRRQYKALHEAHLRSHGPAAPLRPLLSFARANLTNCLLSKTGLEEESDQVFAEQ